MLACRASARLNATARAARHSVLREKKLNRKLDVARFIDERGVGSFQLVVLALCFVVMIIDGFDAQAVGFVAPLISAEWGVAKASFSQVFAAGLVGMAIGALLFGALADRFGRKTIIIFCFSTFGILTVAKAFVSSIAALDVLQLLAGLGIGGAMPNAIALISEYSPIKRRSLMVTVASAGYSVGASGAGFLTARLAGTYGWQSTFLIGGAAALAMLPVLVVLLPESIRFNILLGAGHSKLLSILRKIDPRLPADIDFELTSSERELAGFPVAHLFREGRKAITIFLWLAVFMDLLVIYYMTSWLPITIHGAGGISVEDAAIAAALFSAAGLFGTPVVGQLMDWFGPVRMLALSFLLASICIAFTGSLASSHTALKIIVFFAGFFSVGAHLGLSALAGELYPTFMRATGVGWALGIGRFGSLISPVLGGLLLAWQWQLTSIFLAVALPAFLAALLVLAVGLASSTREEIALPLQSRGK
jgi:AAHS family 4-hydroxybenzoate transporter-like MFS transporter